MFRNDTVMADGPGKEGEPNRAQGASGPTPQESAESKRLEARRRFLLGGAAALPLIVNVRAANADEEGSISFCISLFGTGDHELGDSDESLTLFECDDPDDSDD